MRSDSHPLLSSVEARTVASLAALCDPVDSLVYRWKHPLIRLIAHAWNCRLARLSVGLDNRWHTGFWDGGRRPGPPCEICLYRPSVDEITVERNGISGPLYICAWCDIALDWSDFDVAFQEARRRALQRD